jgi:hypothetical protein
MRKLFAAAVVALMVVLGLAIQSTASGSGGKDIVDFDTMAPVDGPFVGPSTPIRGLAGGGLPWQLDRARGELRSDGRLEVRVEGLVLARKDPVPANLQGTNPIPQFRAAVSCLTTAQPVTGETVFTDPFPASPQGDARVKTEVSLPDPCFAPIVFVTSPTNQWFAVTGG